MAGFQRNGKNEGWKMKGRISTFGGPDDTGMTKTEGLALYEHHEADKRLDLFELRSADLTLGTSQRLRPGALYFAMRFDHEKTTRGELQRTKYRFCNSRTGASAVASLTDWGPNIMTRRTFDLSPGLAFALAVKTDD
jgi:hypothetical protein